MEEVFLLTARPTQTNITLAITGGTGRFRTAHGFIHAVNSSNTETQLTVHLIR